MGKASNTRRQATHRQQIAAQRAAARHAQVRNRMLLAVAAVIAVVAVAVAFVVVKTGSDSPAAAPPPADGPTGAALASVVMNLTTVPAGVLDTVGAGSLSGAGIGSTSSSTGYLAPVTGSALTSGGKPEVLYVGADFCPYCAAVRWPLIVALSRFGTFSGLSTTRSAIANGAGQKEPYPATPTWTFAGSHYTSRYLTFTAAELQTNVPDRKTGGYTDLQTLTAAQQELVTKYDSGGSIPFIDVGNAYVQLSSLEPFGPQDIQHLTWSQIASALHTPSSALAKSIGGSANFLTAAFCKLTKNQPASACTPAIQALQPRLG